jgi:hypothetical protein
VKTPPNEFVAEIVTTNKKTTANREGLSIKRGRYVGAVKAPGLPGYFYCTGHVGSEREPETKLLSLYSSILKPRA